MNLFRPALLLVFCLGLSPILKAQPLPITLEDIWEKGTFQAKGGPRGVRFLKDGIHYATQNGSKIEKIDLRNGQSVATLFDAGTVTGNHPDWSQNMDDYQFAGDEQTLLLSTKTKSIYRRSSESRYFTGHVSRKTVEALYDKAPQRHATFSPQADKVAFVANNNLFIKNLTDGSITQITSDGQPNEIINGASDWCYEEEFELVKAFEWSPDGSKIAFLRFDEREVPEMVMERYSPELAYPELVKFKYPKVGEKNAKVSAFVYHVDRAQLVPMQLEQAEDDYIPRLTWTPDGTLCLTKMNRHQNHLWLLLANADSGKCRTLLEETNKCYIELHEPHFLASGAFVWQTEKSGFNHLYLYDSNGKEKAALTKGNYDVTDFYGVDEKKGLVFYQAAAVNPMQRELYTVNLKGKKNSRLSKEPAYHSAQFSSSFDYYIGSFSNLNDPARYFVRDRQGKIVRELEQNQPLRDKMAQYGAVKAQFIEVPIHHISHPLGGTWEGSLNGFIMKPTHTAPGTKHPVLMFVYGGPGSQQVLDQWKGANYWWFQMLVQQGYIVACVDNRGTGARGEAFKKATYLQLGKLETADQAAAARYFASLPEVDASRIGIFGWSYGGYMSSLCLLKASDVFKAAIAVAPVTNWKWYDSIYTERYMRTHQENESGYEDNSPINFASQLKGNYMLVHGLTDDNVHFQHSAEMSNQLISANKQFEAMIYPNRNHGIGDRAARLHLYRKMTQFLSEQL